MLGGVSTLPPVAWSEFGDVRVPERNSLGAAMRCRFWGSGTCGAGCGWWLRSGAGQDKPSDLVRSALVRGRLGELLWRLASAAWGIRLIGLPGPLSRRSMPCWKRPMAEVLEKHSSGPCDRGGSAGAAEHAGVRCFQPMLAHESGEWDAAAESELQRSQMDPEEVAGLVLAGASGPGKSRSGA